VPSELEPVLERWRRLGSVNLAARPFELSPLEGSQVPGRTAALTLVDAGDSRERRSRNPAV
jgi:hypothetical protein